MDAVALEGYAAVLSGIIVFCGSVWLLLSLVLGSRLAYFITASVTLAFLLIMSTVWSFTTLGPIGQLPGWDPLVAGADAAEIDFSAASSYPDGDWIKPATDDVEQTTQATEAEGAASTALEKAIEDKEVSVFEKASDAESTADSTRLLEQNDELYAATLFQAASEDDKVKPAEIGDPSTVLVITQFNPGNPNGKPRIIGLGVLVLFALHLFGLSRAERKARETSEKYA